MDPVSHPDGRDDAARPLLLSVFLVVALGFVAGPAGVILGVALAAAVTAAKMSGRTMLLISIGVLAIVPVEVLVHGLPGPFTLSPDFVRRNLLANQLGFTGAVLLVAGIFRAHAAGGDGPLDGSGARLHRIVEDAAGPRPRRAVVERARAHGFALGLIAVAAVGLAVRFVSAAGSSPDLATSRIVSSLLQGNGYAIPGPFGGLAPTALRMPVVPALLLLSRVSSAPLFAARVLWALIGSATIICTGWAGGRLVGRRAGWISAIVVAVLPVFWVDSGRIGAPPVAAFWVSVLLLLLATWFERGLTYGVAVLFGLVAALLALTVPEGVVVAAALAGAGAAGIRHRGTGPAALPGIAGLVAFLVVFGPWIGRSEVTFRTLLPSTETGRIEAGANAGAAYTGRFTGSFDQGAADAATRTASVLPPGESGLDRKLRGTALRYAASHPAGLAVALATRILRTFELWSPTNERAVRIARGAPVRGWLLRWASFLPLLALALWGLRRSWSERVGPLLPLFAAPAAVALVALVTYGEPTMRSVVDPALAIAAAIPLADRMGKRSFGRRGDGSRRPARSHRSRRLSRHRAHA